MNKLQLIFVSLLLAISFSSFAQVGIGTDTPHASAALDITSTTGGLLPPRMKASQRDVIDTPKQGLIIFCTDCALGEGELQIRHTSGWKNIIGFSQNNQIKNVADPTDDQDAATKNYVDNNANNFSGSYNDLTDTPVNYTQAEVDALIASLQSQIDNLVADDTPSSTIPTEGLLAYYPLDGNGNDESSFDNNLIINGTVDFVAGFDGTENSAANFTNSLAGYLEMPSSSYGHINDLTNGSVSFWIKLDSKFVSNHYFNFGNSFMVKQKRGVGQDLFIGLKDNTTQVMVQLSGIFPTAESNYIVGATSLELDTWYNLTTVWEGNQNKLYINGVLDGEVTLINQGISDRSNADWFSIGSATYGTNTGGDESDSGAYGSMDNIGFWNRALTQQEISGLYSID